MTRYSLHVQNWSNCKRCDLHKTRTNVVLGRGQIPSSVCFVGESPGRSEDICGEAFIGPAGEILDDIIKQAQEMIAFTYAITNLIGCIPTDEENDKLEPPYESVEACAPRLIEFVKMCNPRLLVCVGKHAESYLDTKLKYRIRVGDSIPRVSIKHPAAIIRVPISARPLDIKRQVLTLANAVQKALTEEGKSS
jgi:uracil-DNA glycosylase